MQNFVFFISSKIEIITLEMVYLSLKIALAAGHKWWDIVWKANWPDPTGSSVTEQIMRNTPKNMSNLHRNSVKMASTNYPAEYLYCKNFCFDISLRRHFEIAKNASCKLCESLIFDTTFIAHATLHTFGRRATRDQFTSQRSRTFIHLPAVFEYFSILKSYYAKNRTKRA